jgi:small-conductance mechanosensitive channel
MRAPIGLLLALLLLLGGACPVMAADATRAPPALTSGQAQQLLDVLQDPAKRNLLVTTLQTMEKLVPVSAVTAAKPAVAPAPIQAPEKPAALLANSLGADLLDQASGVTAETGAMLSRTAREITDFPALGAWVVTLLRDPGNRRLAAQAMIPLAVIFAIGLLLEVFVVQMSRRFYAYLGGSKAHAAAEEKEPEAPLPPPEVPPADADAVSDVVPPPGRIRLRVGWLLLQRLPFILLALGVDLLGPAVFGVVAFLLLATPLGGGPTMRIMFVSVIGLYLRARLVYCLARALIASPAFRLRLLHIPDRGAAFIRRWVRRIVAVIVCGYVLATLALFLGMSPVLEIGFLHMLGLAVHLLMVWAILACRKPVARWIAGRPGGRTNWAKLRRHYAPFWHIHAVILVIAVWFIFATSSYSGHGRPIHFVVSTLGILIIARIVWVVLLGGLDRVFPNETGAGNAVKLRAAHYHRPVRLAVQVCILVGIVLALCQAWGLGTLAWLVHDRLGSRLVDTIFNLVVTLMVAVVLWEVLNLALQSQLDRLTDQGNFVRAARLRTVLPLLRNALMIVLIILIVLTALSQIGVNVAPLLAGASIFGVALGFGSQKLVQDFITGIFLLLENAMQVGDSVTAAGLSGTVEHLSIRTLRLRAGDGSVHLIPFSAVSTVTNSNRGLGNAAVSVTLDWEEDTDRVGAMLSRIAVEMRGEEAFASGMLSDLQLWGVNAVDGMTATLAGQIVCTDGARWAVQREFNRRVKLSFQKEGIRMLPSVTVTGFRHPLDVRIEQSAAPPPAGDAPEPGQAHI